MSEFLFVLFSKIRFKWLKRKADALHDANGKRYYVIPYYGNKLLVVCNDDIKILKKKGVLKKSITHLDVMANCLYYTNSGGKDYGKMSAEKSKEREQEWGEHLARRYE